MEAFVAVATELHFGRAADTLRIGQPTLSDLIRRLEREVGAPLLTRTTRRVALTQAGIELFGRAKVILDDVEGAAAAIRRLADGDAGTVRLGITPPVAPVLSPHLTAALGRAAPDVRLEVQRMWLPDLERAIAEGAVDVAITCGPAAVLRPVSPPQFLPYTLQWCPIRATTVAVGRFVHLALSVDVPAGWVSQPDHLRHELLRD